jgi:hypothetical protein
MYAFPAENPAALIAIVASNEETSLRNLKKEKRT